MRIKFDIGIGSDCPHCHIGTIRIVRSKFGEFYGCSRYPYCAFSQNIDTEENNNDEPEDNDIVDDSYLVFK